MILELVLLLFIYAFLILGIFLGPGGPIQRFKDAGPYLAARIERNIAIGARNETGGASPGDRRFSSATNPAAPIVQWKKAP